MPAWLETIIDFLLFPFRGSQILFEFITTYWVDLKQWLWLFITAVIPDRIAYLVPQSMVDFINSYDIAGLLDILTDIAWFVPIVPLITLYASGHVIVTGIRLVRWIIGFVPTIEG